MLSQEGDEGFEVKEGSYSSISLRTPQIMCVFAQPEYIPLKA